MLEWMKKQLERISPQQEEATIPPHLSDLHANSKPLTTQDILRQYQTHPSLSAHLPWVDWSDKTNAFLLEDGISVGCLLELRDRSTESLPEHMIADMHQKLTGALSRLVPLEDINPWVVQLFIQDDPTLSPLEKQLHDYVPTHLRDDPFTQNYLNVMGEHFKALCRPEGLFVDPLSDIPYRGKTRRIRLAVYRRYSDKKHPPEEDVLEELASVSEGLITNLQAMGLKVRRLRGKGVYDWLVRWFNPHPAMAEGDVDQLLQQFPYPNDEKKPFGWSFCQNIFFNSPESSEHGWVMDGQIHKVMAFRELNTLPDIGLISRERAIGDSRYALFDKLPEGAIYTIQITFESKRVIEKHLDKIHKNAVGKGDTPELVRKSVARARFEMANHHLLFRVVQAIYYRAPNPSAIRMMERRMVALLANAGLSVIAPSEEINILDTYLRFLPFNFNPDFDKRYAYRSSYQYASDVAALLPVYGRSRGQGMCPLHILFNRGGEAFIFDYLSTLFKVANSHMAILGSTGSGKSVFLNTTIIALLAMYNARIVVIEAGSSFDLLADYVREKGRSVTKLTFDRERPVAVNPYAESHLALSAIEKEEALFSTLMAENEEAGTPAHRLAVKQASELNEAFLHRGELASTEELGQEQNRNILAEMTMATRVMVTGGLAQEEARFTLSDKTLIIETLIATLKRLKNEGKKQLLTSDVIQEFKLAAKNAELPDIQKRLDEMARSLSAFIMNPLEAQFLNRPSDPFQQSDLSIINLGFLQDADNAAMMSVVFIGLLSKILSLAEKNQSKDRPTILIIDEAHIPLKNPLVSTFLTLMAKVARKIGLWICLATQNVKDFDSQESKKILSMMETLICLSLGQQEINHVKEFRAVSEEEEALLQGVRKSRFYSEGVLLGVQHKGLFRNVPPRLMLALAMTEQTEKQERQAIMDEHGVSGLRAVEMVAEGLLKKRAKVNEDEGFYD